MPSSQVENPAMLWPPPRTAIVEVVAAREADGGDHVGGAGAADDERGPPAVVRAVPDPARLGVAASSAGVTISPRTASRSSWIVASPSTGEIVWLMSCSLSSWLRDEF